MLIRMIEDDPIALAVLRSVLARAFDCELDTHTDPEEALARSAEAAADLVLVDYQMPGLDGVEVIRRLRADPAHATVPVVMITADPEREVRIEAIAAGATDFLNKPVDPEELKVRVRNLLRLRDAQVALADRARHLAAEVERATRRLLAREEEVIWRLARAIEYRDGTTGDHIGRVAIISLLIARELGLPDDHCRYIYLAAPLHDIGKVGVPDRILNKPGRLTDAEFAEMRRHVDYGAAILGDGDTELVRIAARIAGGHHEKWDGSGYPRGLAGCAIPIEARIVAVADVFDALCSERSYKAAWPPEEARAQLRAGAGRHFDPACIAAFDRVWPEILDAMAARDCPAA